MPSTLADLTHPIGIPEHVDGRLQPLVLLEVDDDLLFTLLDASEKLRQVGFTQRSAVCAS